MTKKFQALRAISVIYKVIAVLVVVGYILFVFLILAVSPMVDGRNVDGGGRLLYAGLMLIVGALVGLGIYAVAEVIDLLISMEENTRATRLALMHLAKTNPAAFDERGSRIVR